MKLDNPIKEAYGQIKTPLGYEENIKSLVTEKRATPTPAKWMLHKAATAAAAFCIVFLTVLNCNPSFANQVKDIPVIGELFSICTFVEMDYSDGIKTITVSEPEIDLAGNTALQKKINNEIQSTIDMEIDAAKIRADEYYNAYISTGGNPEEYMPLSVTIDYDTKCITENYASFMIYKYETLASAYCVSKYYNLDLKSGKQVSLKDMLGSNYKNKIIKKIEADIDSLPQNEKSNYFDDVDISTLISDNRNFYISPDEKSVVVVFNKYEIAIGAMGELEFLIPIN